MTGMTDNMEIQKFDTGEGAGDAAAASGGQQLLAAARLVAVQLRRTVVFAPVFGIVYLVMGFLWYQDVQVERALDSKYDTQMELLGQPAAQPEMLLKQVEGWNTAYEVTLDGRVSRSTDSDLIGRVIAAAESVGLVVLETGTNDDGIATLGDNRYTATPLLMRANGTLGGIERFLNVLETDEFAAFEVQASMFNAETVGYVLTLRGVFYSLPENYSDVLAAEDLDTPAILTGPASGTDAGGVAP